MNTRAKVLGSKIPAMGTITLQSILENLPEAQRRRRRAEQLRSQQERFIEMQGRTGQGNYQPRQQGGWFPTVQAYQKDYERFGNQMVGGLGEILSGRRADRAEDDLNDLIIPEIMRSVEQAGQARNSQAPSGGESPTVQTLRAYMNMLGGPDMKDALGRDAYVSSTQKLKNGNLGLVMSNGDVRDTGIEYDPKTVVTNIPGQPYGVTAMRGGQGTFSPVTGFPGGGGQMPQAPQAPGSFGNPVQNGEQHIEQILSTANALRERGVPDETIEMMLHEYLNPPGGGGMPPMQQPPMQQPPMQQPPMQQPPMPGGIAMVPTKAQEAGEAEAARIAAQVDAAVPIAEAEATKKSFVLDAEAAATARAQLPRLEATFNEASDIVKKLKEHEGLDYIVGRFGGMVPDNTAAKTLFKVVMAGHPANAAMALHDQLYGQVYLNAFETLKGGGQITEFEGKTAAAAKARMDRAQSKEEYLAAADDFLAALKAGMEKLAAAGRGEYSLGAVQQAPAVAPARPQLPPGFSWED